MQLLQILYPIARLPWPEFKQIQTHKKTDKRGGGGARESAIETMFVTDETGTETGTEIEKETETETVIETVIETEIKIETKTETKTDPEKKIWHLLFARRFLRALFACAAYM